MNNVDLILSKLSIELLFRLSHFIRVMICSFDLSSVFKYVTIFVISVWHFIFFLYGKSHSFSFLILIFLIIRFVLIKTYFRSQKSCSECNFTFCDQGMVVNLFPCDSVGRIGDKTFLNKIKSLLGNIYIWIVRFGCLYVFKDFPVINALVRNSSIKHLIEYDT